MVLAEPATVAPMDPSSVNDYQERLALAMRHAGKDPDNTSDVSWLASELRITYQAARKVFDGGTKALSAANNAMAARILGVSPDWLALGEREGGPMLGDLPFTPELITAVRQAAGDERRKAENAARNIVNLDPLPKTATPADPSSGKQAAALAA